MTPRTPGLAAALILTAGTVAGCSTATESVRDETGAITETNDTASVFEMEIGDCYDDPDSTPLSQQQEGDEVETLPAVPCTDGHVYEVYASTTMDDDEYPGEEATAGRADEACIADFEQYVGLPYDESELEVTYLYPTSSSWSLGDDREITCLALDPAGPISGTLEGARR